VRSHAAARPLPGHPLTATDGSPARAIRRPSVAWMGSAARWRATCECMVGVACSRPTVGVVPPPLRRAPGPTLVIGARYTSSPVGPYVELAVVEPVRLGVRPGMCATVMVVDGAASRDAGRARWSFPKELGTLRWSQDEGGTVRLRWEEGDVEVSGQPLGPVAPVPTPAWFLQCGDAGLVATGGLLRGRGRLASVRIETGADGPMATLVGRHLGLCVDPGTLTMGRARPLGCSDSEAGPRRPVGSTAPYRSVICGLPGLVEIP